MTLKQIERTREFLKLVDSVHGLTETQKLADEIRAFYGDEFNVNLKIRTWNTVRTYSSEFIHTNATAKNSNLGGLGFQSQASDKSLLEAVG